MTASLISLASQAMNFVNQRNNAAQQCTPADGFAATEFGR